MCVHNQTKNNKLVAEEIVITYGVTAIDITVFHDYSYKSVYIQKWKNSECWQKNEFCLVPYMFMLSNQ
jgi:hypothetical protein